MIIPNGYDCRGMLPSQQLGGRIIEGFVQAGFAFIILGVSCFI